MTVSFSPYVYKARVVEVIDGDSIVLDVSLGFGNWLLATRTPGGQRARYPQGVYRLAGIDTPEMNTGEGKEARARVLELLSLNKDGDSVMIRTHKEGKYGRYLVDLYIETDGGQIHVNQQLLDEGLAKPYGGGKKG